MDFIDGVFLFSTACPKAAKQWHGTMTSKDQAMPHLPWVIMAEHIHVLLWPPFALIAADPAGMQDRVRES